MAKKLSKEELKKQLDAITAQEEKEIIEKHYPLLKEKYEGKYFKYKNCYSCPSKPEDYWFMYTKVESIKPEDIYDAGGNGVTARFNGWSFQTDKYGKITIEPEDRMNVHRLQKEISEKEFNAAFNKMISSITILSNQLNQK